MEHVSHKDKQKEEVCPEKEEISVSFSVFLNPFLGGKTSFPTSRMNFFLLSGENCTKKCYDPKIRGCLYLIWSSVEEWLLKQFPETMQIATPFNDPLFPIKDYQECLRSLGYE